MSRLTLFLLLCLAALMLTLAACQRSLLYFPTHREGSNGLEAWRHQGELLGLARVVPSADNVWLLLHGNGGQASDRVYALPSFSRRDSVYIMEYPGYGQRPGAPSKKSIETAAKEAYLLLRETYPGTPVCVAGESLGSGAAAFLGTIQPPPDKIVLVVPFDKLSRVGQYHYPFLPVRLLLLDDWDNIKSLKGYQGRVEIFGARNDKVIPVTFAQSLAQSRPGTVFHEIEGGHNDWSTPGRVSIRNP